MLSDGRRDRDSDRGFPKLCRDRVGKCLTVSMTVSLQKSYSDARCS
jgi:hypothetical protein